MGSQGTELSHFGPSPPSSPSVGMEFNQRPLVGDQEGWLDDEDYAEAKSYEDWEIPELGKRPEDIEGLVDSIVDRRHMQDNPTCPLQVLKSPRSVDGMMRGAHQFDDLIPYFSKGVGMVCYTPTNLTGMGEHPMGETFFYVGSIHCQVPKKRVWEWMAQPALCPPHYQDLQMLQIQGTPAPAHLPDLSDLQRLPKGLVTAIQWILQQEGEDEEEIELSYRGLFDLIDPIPILPSQRETTLMTYGMVYQSWSSSTNMLKAVQTVVDTHEVELMVGWKLKTEDLRLPKEEKYAIPLPPVEEREWSARFTQRTHACYSTREEKFICPILYEETGARKELERIPPLTAPMTLLSWNARGTGRRSFRGNLRTIIRAHNPDFMIITETKVGRVRAERIVRWLGYDGIEMVEPVGLSGGILLLWRTTKLHFNPISVHSQCIHGVVQVRNANLSFFLSAVYAKPKYQFRKLLRANLVAMKNVINLPWLAIGDFNEKISAADKFGGVLSRCTKLGITSRRCWIVVCVTWASVGRNILGITSKMVGLSWLDWTGPGSPPRGWHFSRMPPSSISLGWALTIVLSS